MSTFPVNPENVVEMARLLNQHTLLTNAMGGMLVELSSEKKGNIHDVLDLACGPGGWVLEMARTFPHTQVTGVDVSTIMVDYAQTTAQSQALQNAHFLIMDIFAPLNFPDNSFDLINGRLLSSIVKRDSWPPLVSEMFRLCRGGGIMRLADSELPVTSSPALEQLLQLLARAFQISERSFSNDGKTLAVISHFSSFLRDAGFQNIQEYARTLDFSAHTPLHAGFYQNTMSGFQVIKPFFIGLSLMSEVDYQLLYQQMLIETSAPDFHASSDVLIAWGEKPIL